MNLNISQYFINTCFSGHNTQYFINTCFSGHNTWTLSHKALDVLVLWWTDQVDLRVGRIICCLFDDRLLWRDWKATQNQCDSKMKWGTNPSGREQLIQNSRRNTERRTSVIDIFLLCCYIDIFIYCIFYNKMCW